MPRPKKSTNDRARGIPPIPFKESSTPETDLSRVPVEDLMDELQPPRVPRGQGRRGEARAGRSPGDRGHLHRGPRAGIGATRLGVFPARRPDV